MEEEKAGKRQGKGGEKGEKGPGEKGPGSIKMDAGE